MMTWTRRRLLFSAAAGLAGASCRRASRDTGPADLGLDAVLARLIASDADTVLNVAVDALARGASVDVVLAATCLMPIVTGGDGEDVHSILTVPSIRFLIDAVPAAEAAPVVVWAAQNAHGWMGPRRIELPRGGSPSADGLVVAIRGGDRLAAGAMAHGMCEGGKTAEVAEALIVEGTRPRTDPHAAIYVAQATRALRGPVSAHAGRVWASVATMLARSTPDKGNTAKMRIDENDATTATELALALRRAPALSLDGLAPTAIFGALALLVVEMMLADEQATGVALHRITLLDALHHLYREAPPSARPLILGRAARWVPLEHARLVVASRAPVTELLPDAADYAPGPNAHGEDTFRRALGRASSDEPGFVSMMRRHILEHGTGEHDFKPAAAIFGVAPHLPADARARWLASASLAFGMRSSGRWVRRSKVEQLVRDVGPR